MKTSEVIATATAAISAFLLSTQACGQPIPRTDGIRSVDVNTKHLYKAKLYDTPLLLSANSTISDPVVVLLSRHFEAMRSGQINDFLTTWDDESSNEIRKRQAAESRELIVKRWVDMLANRNVVLVARYEYQQYELVEYRIQNAAGKVVFSDVLTMSDRSLIPKLTLQLKDSPVLRAIREKMSRVDDVIGLTK
jgi:hypothetical protein